MTRSRIARIPTPTWHALAACASLMCAGVAHAEGEPYTIGVSETVSHDSNVVRLADGAVAPAGLASTTDTIFSTALFGNVDQTIGRQRLYGSLSVRDNHYRYNSVYSNVSYGASGGLDWQTIERISGTFAASSNRNLASFNRAIGQNAPNIVKNTEQTDQFSATGRIGVVTDLTLEAGASHQNQRFSERGIGARLSQNVYTMGMRYELGGELTYGVGLRYTDGRYPDLDDSVTGRNLDLSADWVPSPISTVNARLSFGKTDHSLGTAQDFSGTTGSLNWKWQPTGKLLFNTRFTRSTGNDATFVTEQFGTATLTAQADNSRVTTAYALAADYEATAKIHVDAGYTLTSRKLTNSQSINAGQPVTATDGDRLTRLSLGARWAPTRTVEVSCGVSRESQKADNSTLTYAYQANVVQCAAQIAVQP